MIVGTAWSAVAVTLEKFDLPELPASLNQATERKQQLELSAAPDGVKAMRLSWQKDRFKYAEPIFKKQKVLPEFTEATLTVKVYAPANCPVGRFNLRLADASNEIFQWDQRIKWSQPGWKTVTFPLTGNNFSVCWGGNNNKQMDAPVKLFGFGVDFEQDGGAGELWIGEVSVTTTGGEKVTAIQPLSDFASSAKWTPTFYLGQGALKSENGKVRVVAQAGMSVLRDRMWSLESYKRPSAVNLEAMLNSADAAVCLVFRGADNKTVVSPEVKLVAGKNNVQLDLSQVLAGMPAPVWVNELRIVSARKNVDLVLNKADFVVDVPPLAAIGMEIDTANPIRVMAVGKEKELKIRLSNTATVPVDFNAAVTFEDFFGRQFTFSKQFKMKALERVDWQPEWRPARQGIWWVNLKMTDPANKENTLTLRRSFAYMKPAGPTPGKAEGFLFSICTHTERWGERDKGLEVLAAARCGAKVMRTGPGWETIQPAKDVWNWEPLDKMVAMYAEKGMELQYILAFTTRWAAPLEKQNSSNWLDWNRSAPDDAAWRGFASAMAKRYRDKIRYWEIWNEPDLWGFGAFTVEEYVRMMKSAYQEIKKVDPKLQVMTGGFATMSNHPGRKDPLFHEKAIVGAKGYFDIHAYHEHCAFNSYAQRVDEDFIPMRERTGTKVPWYANETAISSMDGTEHFQAETLFKKLLYAWARGAIGYTWYDLRNDGFDPKDNESNFGMVTTDFYPKAIYPAFNALVNYYRDVKYDRQFELGPNLWAFAFKNAKRVIIPCWNEASSSASRHIIIKTDAAKAERIDLMGNAVPLPVLDGMTVLEIATVPSSLNLPGATKAEPAGSLVEPVSGGAAVPGQPYRLAVKMANPLTAARDYVVKLALPPGIKTGQATKTVRIAPQETAEAVFMLHVAESIRAEHGNEPKIKVDYTIRDTPWQGSLDIPVNLAIAIPAGSFDRKPDFTLNSREQVVSLCANDPAKNHLVWRDANDLSAKIWLGAVAGELRLRAVVTDDAHHQPEQGNNVWKGDNIQFAVQVPGQAGCWEIGLSHLNDGKPESFIWAAPTGFDTKKAVSGIKLSTRRENKQTVYDAVIPMATLGLTPELLRQGIRFNLLINDNDGELREGWIHVAPNLGTNKNPASYPFLIFR